MGRVTSSSGTPKTCEAVAAWMSSSLPERLEQARVLRHVGQDAQLDLRVVGGEQDGVVADVAGDEGAAHLAAELAAHRDVLQVRVRRREAAGGGDSLVEGRVDAAVARVDGAGQRLDVGRTRAWSARASCRRISMIGWTPRRASIAWASVRVALLGLAGLGQAELFEQTVESCGGEPRLNSWPTAE